MDQSDPREQREPLAALHTYQPLPTHKIFPQWEWVLRFGWIVALAVAGVVGYRYWRHDAPEPVAQHFAPVTRWTSEPGLNLAPTISLDGKWAAYASDREGSGTLAIWMRPTDGCNLQRVTNGEFNETDPDLSPDGKLIAYRSERDGGGIYVQPSNGGSPKLVARNAWKPKFSPDGRWIAFFTLKGPEDLNASNGGEIFIVPALQGGQLRQIAAAFPYARNPIWSPDGRHLLFTGVRSDGLKDWWTAPIDGGPPARTYALETMTRSLKSVGSADLWRGDSIYFSGAEELDQHVWALPFSQAT